MKLLWGNIALLTESYNWINLSADSGTGASVGGQALVPCYLWQVRPSDCDWPTCEGSENLCTATPVLRQLVPETHPRNKTPA